MISSAFLRSAVTRATAPGGRAGGSCPNPPGGGGAGQVRGRQLIPSLKALHLVLADQLQAHVVRLTWLLLELSVGPHHQHWAHVRCTGESQRLVDDYILAKARQIFLARGPSFGAKVEAEHIVGAGNHLGMSLDNLHESKVLAESARD